MRAMAPWQYRRLTLPTVREEFGEGFGRTFGPPVDTVVKDGTVVVKADLPGIDPKSVEVTVDRDRLTIKGERHAEEDHSANGAIHREVRYGRFERSVQLPGPIDADSVSARYRDGVLEVSFKAPAGTEPMRVPIATA